MNPNMATLPAGTPSDEQSITTPISPVLEAEYKTAVAIFRSFAIRIVPNREEYDQLFYEHGIAQSRHDKIMEKTISHNADYVIHKEHFGSLCNALLASNHTMRTAPRPLTHEQVLTHATLMHRMKHSSEIMAELIYVTKRLEKRRDAIEARDLDLYNKCQELWKQVDSDCAELDNLHANVVELEKKLGAKPACGMVEGGCDNCIRSEERKTDKVAAEKGGNGEGKKGKKAKKGKKGKKGGKGKGREVEQELDDVPEEGVKESGS